MKNYLILGLLALIIVATLLILNKSFLSPQNDPAATKESEEPVGQLSEISRNLASISERLATLSDRVTNLEHQQIESRQQPQLDNTGTKTLATSTANPPQASVADNEMSLLAQATGVTATQLAAMNASQIEILKEQQALEQDKQYFKQLDQYFSTNNPAIFDPAFERSITDSVNLDELSKSKVSTIACDNAMCRVEVKHSDLDAMTKFLDKVPGIALWNTEAIVDFPEGIDKPTSVIYLARKDHSLPVRSAQTQ